MYRHPSPHLYCSYYNSREYKKNAKGPIVHGPNRLVILTLDVRVGCTLKTGLDCLNNCQCEKALSCVKRFCDTLVAESWLFLSCWIVSSMTYFCAVFEARCVFLGGGAVGEVFGVGVQSPLLKIEYLFL